MRFLSTILLTFLAFVLQAQNFTDMTTLLNRIGGSVPCIVDMNNDGLDDVVIISGGDMYIDEQQSDGTFVQHYFDTNFINAPHWSIAAGDIDENGYNDLMFGGQSQVSFIMANNNGTAYSEVFIPDYIFSQRTNLVDIDNDGDLDAFACHDIDESHPYRNDGAGNMTEDQSLIQTVPVAGNYASIWTDFDNDGDVDMYLSKCRQNSDPGDLERENALYVNGGNGNYTIDGANVYGLFDNEQSWVTIFEDLDNDGDLDTCTVNHTGSNYLRENDGSGHYSEITAGSGIDGNGLDSWACIGADFDNDGLVDILTESNVNKQLYHNDGNMQFTGMSRPFDDGALGDLNNDGFIDVFTGVKLWMNNGNANHWSKISLQGVVSNPNGIGARLELYGPWGIQIRESRSGESFNPMSSLDVFFGLGSATIIDSLIVRWPSGVVNVINSPAIDTRLVVEENPCYSPSNLYVLELAFGTPNSRVNASWLNPEGSADCQVRGGRISDATVGTSTPEFANINNTQVIDQTNGNMVDFNVILYNNPNVPFVQGKTYGFEVRCRCSDDSDYSEWSGLSPSGTFVVPLLADGGQVADSKSDFSVSESQLNVFPNPNATNALGIDMTENELIGDVLMELLDLEGRVIATTRIMVLKENQVVRWNLDEKPSSGMYILRLRDNAQQLNQHIIFE